MDIDRFMLHKTVFCYPSIYRTRKIMETEGLYVRHISLL